VVREPVNVVFENGAKFLAGENVGVWDRVWLKPEAERWASANRDGVELPMAGYWRVGSGCVAATAFDVNDSEVEELANLIAAKPRDPRFSVRWATGRRVRVIVDAVDAGKFLNGLQILLKFMDEPLQMRLEQTGPGRYEASFDAGRNSGIATVRLGDEVIDRMSLPGRYSAEFDAVGNDHAAMGELAEKSGGAVIWPTDRGLIDFRWPRVKSELMPWICGVALVLIGAGVIWWRIN
jgi:hypothetical protein